MPSENDHRPRKTLAKIAALCVFGFAVAWYFKETILNTAGHLIVATDSIDILDGEPAVLLMGDRTGERAETAIRFLNAFPASKIYVTQEEPSPLVQEGIFPHAHDLHRKLLIDSGVSPDRILSPECINSSTLDEAFCVKNSLTSSENLPTGIVVITSWYHSGRAKWIFKKVFSDTSISVKSFTASRPGSSAKGWWKQEFSFINVFNEYLKWTYWFFNQEKMERTQS